MAIPNPGNFLNASNVNTFNNYVDKLIADLSDGRFVKVHKDPLISDCPNCGFDSINRRSNNVYNNLNPNPSGPLNKSFGLGKICPVCFGNGVLNTPQYSEIPCIIIKNSKEMREVEEKMGLKPQSTIKLICEIEHHSLMFSAKQATIDGALCERVGEITTLGLPPHQFMKCLWKLI